MTQYRYQMHDLASVVGLSGLAGETSAVEIWTDGDTVYNARGELVPKIAIPKGETDARARWNKNFRDALERTFLATGGSLRPVKIPVDPSLVTNNNPVKNRGRYSMYMEMARAERELPPVIVRVEPRSDGRQGYFVIDGNHRFFAAQAVGLREMDALLMTSNAFGALFSR